MQRRQLLKSTAAFSAASVLGAPAIAQAPKKITFLTWNLVHLEAPLKGWIAGFIKSRPGVEVEWVDKKGPELPAGATLTLGVRPEHLVWHEGGVGGGTPLVEGTASLVEPLGSDTLVSLDVGGTAVIARLPPRVVRRKGEAVRLAADPANLHFFDSSTGLRQTM